jgi:hypothetical protein
MQVEFGGAENNRLLEVYRDRVAGQSRKVIEAWWRVAGWPAGAAGACDLAAAPLA